MRHDPKWLVECRQRAPQIAQAFVDGLGRGDTRLSSPGCPKGCDLCFRECAVRYIQADWWTQEHAKAEAVAPTFVHDGVA